MEFFSPGHLLVIAIVALVLFFGWKQLPDMARSVGRSLRIFKTEMKGMAQDNEKREQAGAEPEAPRALPAAEVVRNDTATTVRNDAATPVRNDAAATEPARPRPRPAPGRPAEASERRADAS